MYILTFVTDITVPLYIYMQTILLSYSFIINSRPISIFYLFKNHTIHEKRFFIQFHVLEQIKYIVIFYFNSLNKFNESIKST